MNDEKILLDETMIDILEKRALESPDDIAYTFLDFDGDKRTEKNITYKQIYDNARAIAIMLKDKGLKPGDGVIILSSQTYDNIYSIFAAMFAGAVFTIIPPPIDEGKRQRFKSIFESFNVRFILCDRLITEKLESSIFPSLLPKFTSRLIVKMLKDLSIINVENCNKNVSKWEKPIIYKDTLTYIQYTSGSTSMPKGTMISQGNIMAQMKGLHQILVTENCIPKVSTAWVPFFHNIGLAAMIFLPLYSKFRSVNMSPLAFLENPIRWLEAISDFRGELIIAPDSIYGFCGQFIDDYHAKSIDLSCVKLAVDGSEPINPKNTLAFTEKFSASGFDKSAFTAGYGLSETVCVSAVLLHGIDEISLDLSEIQEGRLRKIEGFHKNAKAIVCCGRPIPGIKAVIVNPESMEVCQDSSIGEIWLQGDPIAMGYWKMKEETDKTFKNRLPGYSGTFLRTGDLGSIVDEKIYITGRLKEMIIINGHNIFSHDISASIKDRIPFLKNANIISFSTVIDNNEQVVTCIENTDNISDEYGNITGSIFSIISEVFGFCPVDIIFIKKGTLPRTDSNKIQINKARDLYDTGKLNIVYSSRNQSSINQKSLTSDVPENEVEKAVYNIVVNTLGITHSLSIHDDLFTHGADSMTMAQIIKKIETTFRISFPVHCLIEEPTVKGIGIYIEDIKNNREIYLEGKSKEYFYEECSLDSNIHPRQYEDTDELCYDNVFITGTTGFVGAYLIKELAQKTEANLYCHVRASNTKDAFAKVKRNMEFYNCWDDKFDSRIKIVLGDLSSPLLGIDEKTFEDLSTKIDAIYHNGAVLHFVYSYNHLKKTNVLGTHECLRLACKNKAKYFHYVSSFGVYDNPSHFNKTAYEDDILESPEGYFLGYSESKWVSEKLIQLAKKRGLRATIFRPGEISGDQVDGKWKLNDMVSRFLVTSIQLQVIPLAPIKLYLTPVDYVAKAMVHLSLQQDSMGKAFNLVNNNVKNIISLSRILRSYGYNIRIVSYWEWKKILFESGAEHPLMPLKPLFCDQIKGRKSFGRRHTIHEPKYDISNTLKGLNESGITCPPVDRQLIYNYLKNFINQGYIPDPKK